MQIYPGVALPFGVSHSHGKWNFSIFSAHATQVVLSFFPPGSLEYVVRVPLDPMRHRTGHMWHCTIEGLDETWRYAYFIDGPKKQPFAYDPSAPLLDPFATAIDPISGLAILPIDPPFEWKGDRRLKTPLEESVIYEMHVRGFTQDPSSQVESPGTFLGVIEKIPYLQSLGVTAVELLPVHLFDPKGWDRRNPLTQEQLCNYWGYASLNFFSLATLYSKVSANREFKEMVLELHKAGIEVILDVVFNHTGEVDHRPLGRSFRAIERPAYYMLNEKGEDMNYSGCGNTFNCNYPVTREMIHMSLRYFSCDMHVDGFRFDLASILGRDQQGRPLVNPPLIERIAYDPILADCKLIAEAWDAGGLYQVGTFATWGAWSEWNGKYRDTVRSFIKGDKGKVGDFVTRLAGSSDIYGRAHPSNSINFITAHDGFSLYDLVSYNQKHNEANGEGNRDGNNDNLSWNCGAEGDTNLPEVLALRKRQMRNFYVALLTSQGAAMIQMGDEYGHTRKGNNNAWCHDNRLNWFCWDECEKNAAFCHFVSSLIHFRRQHSVLTQRHFLDSSRVQWHGPHPGSPDWSYDSHFIAFTLIDQALGQDLYIAFNAKWEPVTATLPEGHWTKIVDTASEEGIFWPHAIASVDATYYTLSPYSSLILKKFNPKYHPQVR